MAVSTTFTSQTRTQNYITNDQFKRAPTPVDYQKLVSGGRPQEQEDQLYRIITRASAWVDSICMQVLQATTDTEQGIISANRYGEMTVHPRYHPVLQLNSFAVGPQPGMLQQIGNSGNAWVEEKRIVVPGATFPFNSSAGPLQFGGASVGTNTNHIFAAWTYINGYTVTQLVNPVSAGATSITLKDATGVVWNSNTNTMIGAAIRFEDGATSEWITVTGPSVNNVVPVAALQNNHLAGAAVTGLPADVEEAVILATTAYVKLQGTGGLVAPSTGGASTTSSVSDPFQAGNDFQRAQKILQLGDYIRVSIG